MNGQKVFFAVSDDDEVQIEITCYLSNAPAMLTRLESIIRKIAEDQLPEELRQADMLWSLARELEQPAVKPPEESV